MTAYVLIHGGAHGAWCWDRLTPFLEQAEPIEDVLAVDLLDSAQALTGKPLADISNDDYINAVTHEITSRNYQSVVLVGHSMAGITLPGVAARVPQRIRHVLYLSTSNPPVGESVEDVMKHPLSPLSRDADLKDMFCSDLDDDTCQWLLSNLREDPPKPFSEAVEYCALPPGIPATYILLQEDQALLPEFQLEQAANAGITDIVWFRAGHSAFASRPAELAELLLRYK